LLKAFLSKSQDDWSLPILSREYNYVALIALSTYPVSTCTNERSFRSIWRDFKTPSLPSTMTDGRLSSLAILHKHKQVDIDGIITEFPRLTGRRLLLWLLALWWRHYFTLFFSVNNLRVKSTINYFIYLVTENVLHDTREEAFLRP